MPSGCGGTALHEETPATKPSSSARAPLHPPYMHPSSCSHAPCTILCEQGDGAERHADPRGGEGRGGAARGAAELSRQGFGGHARRTRERPRGTPERCAARAAAAPQVGRAAEPQSHLPRVAACDVGPGLAPGVAARTKTRAMAAVWRSLQGGLAAAEVGLTISSAAARMVAAGRRDLQTSTMRRTMQSTIAPRHSLARRNSVMRENRALADAKFDKLRCLP